MSLVQKISPVGIDTSINIIQEQLYNHLTTKALWTKYESYPKAYKNPLGENIIPEIVISRNPFPPKTYKHLIKYLDYTRFQLTEIT